MHCPCNLQCSLHGNQSLSLLMCVALLQIWHANFAGYYSGVEGEPLLLCACPLQLLQLHGARADI